MGGVPETDWDSVLEKTETPAAPATVDTAETTDVPAEEAPAAETEAEAPAVVTPVPPPTPPGP